MLASDFKFCFGCICLSHVCFIHQSPQVVSCSSKPVVALVMQPIILQHTVVLLLPNIDQHTLSCDYRDYLFVTFVVSTISNLKL